MFLLRLQGKFEIDHSRVFKRWGFPLPPCPAVSNLYRRSQSNHTQSRSTPPTRAAAVNSSIIPSSFTPQIRLQNPSTKSLVYQVILTGKDRADFTLPMGDTVQVQSKGQLQMPVEFRSRFLRPCGATLVLVGKRVGSPCGSTLVFTLDTCIDNIVPMVTDRLSAAPQSYMIIEVSYSRFRC